MKVLDQENRLVLPQGSQSSPHDISLRPLNVDLDEDGVTYRLIVHPFDPAEIILDHELAGLEKIDRLGVDPGGGRFAIERPEPVIDEAIIGRDIKPEAAIVGAEAGSVLI